MFPYSKLCDQHLFPASNQLWMVSYMQSICVLQKKAMTIICDLKSRDYGRSHFKTQRIHTLFTIYIQSVVIFPHNNKSLLTINDHCHEYPHVLDTNYEFHSTDWQKTQHFVDYWAPRLYNHLSENLKNEVVKYMLINISVLYAWRISN